MAALVAAGSAEACVTCQRRPQRSLHPSRVSEREEPASEAPNSETPPELEKLLQEARPR